MSLEARFMQAVEKLDGFKLQLVFQKIFGKSGTYLAAMHVCFAKYKASIHELKCKL
jgi:hypothetical protein